MAYYVVKVLNQTGEWYSNALVENSHDAIAVATFYRQVLGYSVQLWYEGKDVSFLIDAAHFAVVTP